MKTVLSTALRATLFALSPLSAPTAFAAGAGGAPTLMRIAAEPQERPNAVALTTERCVSALKSHDLDAASAACESAVAAARRDFVSAQSALFVPYGYSEEIAIAYNNRAVLHYLDGKLSLAAADANRALSAAALPAVARTAAAIEAARREARTAP